MKYIKLAVKSKNLKKSSYCLFVSPGHICNFTENFKGLNTLAYYLKAYCLSPSPSFAATGGGKTVGRVEATLASGS
jgi:hypothetical protein